MSDETFRPTLEKRITIKDVAKRAGVALSTTSYVLNGKNRSISLPTQQRIQEAARDLGYRPNLAARSLVTRQTHILALWISDVASPFSAFVISHLQGVVRRHGYDVIIKEIVLYPGAGSERADQSQWRADGVVAYLGPECRHLDLTALFPSGTPLVSIGALSVPGTDFIELDLFPGTQAAVRHLAQAHCQRIAYLVPEGRMFPGDYRFEAYTAAVREAGQKPEYISVAENSRAAGRSGIQAYGAVHGLPDGIFCYNDGLAIGAYRGLRDTGVRIHEDVRLIGCDGIEDMEYLDCPLSTIVSPLDEMCDTAWQFLERRMREPTTPLQHRKLYPELEVRN